MLSNPPYGKSWKTDLERMGGKHDMRDPRFVIEHAGDPEYSLVTRSSDGQMLFLANKLSKMKQSTAARQPHRRGPQRQFAVHRRRRTRREQHPALDHRERLAGGDRRPAAQHVLQHRHRHLRVGAHQPKAGASPGQGAVDRRHQGWQRPLRKNLGKKNCELGEEDLARICDTFLSFEETEHSKVFDNAGSRVLEGDGGAALCAVDRGRSQSRVQGHRDQEAKGERRA